MTCKRRQRSFKGKKRDKSGQETAGDGATNRLVKAFQLDDDGSVEKRKPLK